jgi:hypothetical protein
MMSLPGTRQSCKNGILDPIERLQAKALAEGEKVN